MTTYDRFKWFREWAGYSTPPGRASCALSLAHAEETLEEATDLDVASVSVEWDDVPYDPGDFVSDEEARRRFESGEWRGPYVVSVAVGDDVASLSGVVFGPEDMSDPYCRVVIAELASELLDELRQAVGDARDDDEGHWLIPAGKETHYGRSSYVDPYDVSADWEEANR